MATTALRKQVIRFVNQASEKELLMIYRLFEMNEKDWWQQTDGRHRAAISKAIKEADSGKVIPHSEMVKQYSKWLWK